MKSIRTFIALLAVILTAPDVWAQQVPVQVSLPDTLVAAGSVLRVPVLVSDLSGLNVTSSDLLIHYDARLVVAKRIRLTGTKTNRWSQAFRVGLVEGSPVKAHSQLKLVGLRYLLMRFAEHSGHRDSGRFSAPA